MIIPCACLLLIRTASQADVRIRRDRVAISRSHCTRSEGILWKGKCYNRLEEKATDAHKKQILVVRDLTGGSMKNKSLKPFLNFTCEIIIRILKFSRLKCNKWWNADAVQWPLSMQFIKQLLPLIKLDFAQFNIRNKPSAAVNKCSAAEFLNKLNPVKSCREKWGSVAYAVTSHFPVSFPLLVSFFFFDIFLLDNLFQKGIPRTAMSWNPLGSGQIHRENSWKILCASGHSLAMNKIISGERKADFLNFFASARLFLS